MIINFDGRNRIKFNENIKMSKRGIQICTLKMTNSNFYLQQIKYQAPNTLMKIPLYDITMVYEKLIEDINVGEVSIVIFTALDVDALCTLKILSKFLKNQNIENKIFPVSSYTELEQKIEDCRAYQKIKLFFFINCGGIIDLSVKWFAKQAQVFLFDINKPIHHANVQSPNIQIVDDNFSDLERAPTTKQVEMYQNLDDQFMDDLEQRQHELPEGQDEDDDIEDIAARRRKRARSSQQAIEKISKLRKIKSQITEKVTSYYNYQFFGLPSSYIAYKMIKELNKSDNSYLWYAIVGLTGCYLEQKIQKDQFDQITEHFLSAMSKLNNVYSASRQDENVNNMIQKDSLKRKNDFQFPLLRHWSLYESIENSSYMIGKLGLWDNQGPKKLHQLINVIGLSLEEAKQLYKYMLKGSIQKLENNISTKASSEKFKLLDIVYQSFAKQVDYAFQMTASDYYYAISAVLQRPCKKTNYQQIIQHRVECFLQAFNLFSVGQSKLIAAMQEAKKILMIYTKEQKNLFQRNHIMHGKAFSFVNFADDTEDRKLFQHPNSLSKLAYNLMFISRQKRAKKQFKPFIASMSNKTTQTSQVVGIMNDPKNSFSSKFTTIIDKLEVDVRFDSFMNNFMTIPKDCLAKIVRQLGQM